MALALLAGKPLVVERPLVAEDTLLFRRALERLGWRVEEASGRVALAPGERPPRADIDCGNAGTMFRFLVAVLAATPGEWRLDGVPRLRERTVGPLVDALRELGGEIACEEREGFAPLLIHGRRLAAGPVRLDAGVSSQFLSALTMAALAAEGEVEIAVPALTSRPLRRSHSQRDRPFRRPRRGAAKWPSSIITQGGPECLYSPASRVEVWARTPQSS